MFLRRFLAILFSSLLVDVISVGVYTGIYLDESCSTVWQITYYQGGCGPIYDTNGVLTRTVDYCNSTGFLSNNYRTATCSDQPYGAPQTQRTGVCMPYGAGTSIKYFCDASGVPKSIIASVTQYSTSSCAGNSGDVILYNGGCLVATLGYFGSVKGKNDGYGNLVYDFFSDIYCKNVLYSVQYASAGCTASKSWKLTWGYTPNSAPSAKMTWSVMICCIFVMLWQILN